MTFRKAGIGAAILAAIAAGALLWAFFSLDLIVKIAFEHYGPDVVGAPVRVSGVHISPRSGEGRLADLEVDNPPGFASKRAVRFGEIRIALDPATVTGNVVLVHEISVDAPLITFERGRDGNNLDAIQRNIEAYLKRTAGSSAGATSGSPSGPRRFIVERISIRGAKVTMTNAALKGQGITFDLPDIQLRDVGKRQNGLRASEVANVVAREVIARIAQRVLTNLDLLKKGGVEGAVDALKGLFK